MSTFACGHCGNEHIVHREGGAIYLAPMAQDVRQIRVGVDKTAAELAVARLTKEMAELEAMAAANNARQEKEWIAPSLLEQSLPYVMGFSVFFLCFGLSDPRVGLLIAVVVGGSLIGLLVTYSRRSSKVKTIKARELERLQSIYNAKSAALAKNRRIAES